MLKKILDDNIIILDSINDWKHSVRAASKPLVDKKNVLEQYVEIMIKDIEKLGFYVVLREGVAMPHSRPENGVLKTSMSLLKLNKPVMYGENSIYLVFVLASKDSGEHIEALTSFSELLQNDEDVELLIKADNIGSIRKIINKY